MLRKAISLKGAELYHKDSVKSLVMKLLFLHIHRPGRLLDEVFQAVLPGGGLGIDSASPQTSWKK